MCSGPTSGSSFGSVSVQGGDAVQQELAVEYAATHGNNMGARIAATKALHGAYSPMKLGIKIQPTADSPTFGLRVKSPAVGAADLRVPFPGGDA